MIEPCAGCGCLPDHQVGSERCNMLKAQRDRDHQIEQESLRRLREEFKQLADKEPFVRDLVAFKVD